MVSSLTQEAWIAWQAFEAELQPCGRDFSPRCPAPLEFRLLRGVELRKLGSFLGCKTG